MEVNTKYKKNIYTLQSVPKKKVCLILGASTWGNKPSHILEDRLLVGIDLYKTGKAERFILSGDHGTKTYDEVNAMKDYLLAAGIHADDIFLDHAGFRTYDSCYRAHAVFGVDSLTIVTNAFHLPRALYIAAELGMDAVGVPSDLRVYLTEKKNNIREFFAQYKAFFDVRIIKPLPRFLGPPIDMKGSGKVTHDTRNP